MKRLQILILIFCLSVSIPLGYFVVRTYRGLEQEEAATLSFFANTLFDKMEQALETLVQQEEGRAIDEYNFFMSPPGVTGILQMKSVHRFQPAGAQLYPRLFSE